MVNFVYLIGDRDAGEAVIVDPAYRVADLLDVLAADDMRLVGALATHYHADHVGGKLMSQGIEGVRELLELQPVPVHVNRHEAEWVKRSVDVSDADLAVHDSGDVVQVGDIPIQLLHTPGHTPGSQCFLVEQMLVSGDTLFSTAVAASTCRAATPTPCTTACSAWRRSPTTSPCSPGIATARRRPGPWPR